MLIATNRFFVSREFESQFEERWKKRESHLDENPGFMRFRLLKQRQIAMGPQSKMTPGTPETTEYISYSEWLNEAAFMAWMNSESSRKVHSAQGPMPTGMLARPPEFRAYGIEIDQNLGHRTDYRSTHQDQVVEKNFSGETPEQRELFRINKEKGLPSINIGAFEGRLLEVLLRAIGARRGIEIGTLGGYSATWLARALPADGKLFTIELESERAEQARGHFKRLELDKKVEVRTGRALDVLKELEGERDLDFVFIDADKSSYGAYARWAIPRLRKGGLLLADNAYIWGGMNYFSMDPQAPPPDKTENPAFSMSNFEGMSDCWKQLATHPEMASIILPTGEGLGVGIKI